MNKIFKVIWNHTTQSWVAVSELTSAKGKTKSKTAAKLTALSLVAGSALMAGNAMGATAAIDTANNAAYISINSSNGTAASATGSDAIAEGNGASAAGESAIAQGNNAKALGSSSIAIGKDSFSGMNGTASEKNVAIGDHATAASNEAIAIGAGAQVASVQPSRINARGIAIGSQAQVAATRDNTGTNSSTDSISIGTRSWSSATNSIVIGVDATSLRNPDSTYPQNAENTVAIGANSSADWLSSTSLGYNSRANGYGGLALGANASSSPSNATRLNNIGGAEVMVQGSVALGASANAYGQAGSALGVASVANGAISTAAGYKAIAMSDYGTSVGTHAYTAKSQDVAIGSNAQTGAVDQGRQTAIGNGAISTTTAGTAIGSRAVSNGIRSTAIGAVSNAYGQSAISIGSSSGSDVSSIGPLSSGTNATTMGTNATAIGTSTLAIGTEAKAGVSSANATTARTAHNTYTTAYRTYASLQQATQTATAANNMAKSNAAALAKNLKIALTGLSTDATAQLTAAGVTADEVSTLNNAINNTDFSTNPNNADAAVTNKEIIAKIAAISETSAGETNDKLAYLVAIAKDLQAKTTTYETTTADLATATAAEAEGKTTYDTAKSTYDSAIAALSAQTNAIAIGNGANAYGANSIAQGTSAIASATRAIAIGNSANASAENAMAQGYNSKASAASAIAQGTSANASAANAIAQGNTAAASGASAIAVGQNSTASGQQGVAVGALSTTAGSQATAVGYGSKASGGNDAAYGSAAEATGGFSTALGALAKSSAQGAAAVGYSANASGLMSSAFGPGANASVERAVALGNRSVADTVARQGFNPASQSASLTGVSNGADDTRLNTYAGLTGNTLTSTLAAVSVGSSTNTRQINHVAAGTADDDAVNVAQLRSVNLKIAGNTSGQTTTAKSTDYDSSTAKSKDNVLLDSQTLSVVSSNTDLLTTDATNNTITITANAQKIVEAAQLPVVYTDKAGNKLIKVGDSFYPATSVVNNGTAYPEGTVIINGNAYVAGTTEDAVNAGTATAATPETAVNNGDVIASMNNGGNSTTSPMALSNVGAGANVYGAVDENGKPLTAVDENGNVLVPVIAADGTVTYYAANQVVNGVPVENATAVTPTSYYTADKFNPTTGKLIAGSTTATPVTTTTATPMQSSVLAAKRGLADLSSANPTNAITVADARNMGWVVSANNTLTDATNGTSNTTPYAAAVKNANEVRFTGTGIATVSGKTDDNGVRTINVHVDAQAVSESAQNPVVYTTADGTKLTKVGDSFYPATSVVNNGTAYPEGTVIINGNAYVAGTTEDAVNAGTATAATPETAVNNGDVIASMNNGGNSTTSPMALSNVGAGANVYGAVDENGKPLTAVDENGNVLVPVIAADGTVTYYAANQVVNGVPVENATAVTPANYYAANQFGRDGKLIANPTATTPATSAQLTASPSLTAARGLADLSSANPTNAITVADARNMGWVVSANNTLTDATNGTSNTTAYADSVKNANEVRFTGTGIATVSGKTDDNGVRTINVHVDAQAVSESAQNPVVYTTADGTKLTKVGNDFYPANAVVNNGNRYPADSVVIDGKVYPAGTTQAQVTAGTATEATPLTATPVANVIASMNNAGNSTTTPMALSNVGAGANTFPAVDAEGNKLTPVTGDDGTITYYPADQVGTDGKLKDADTATPKAALVLANDGKWYDASKVDSKGTPASGATSVDTPKNVGTSGLVDFANSNPTNAATVKDLQNMGWVISTSDNEYEDQVRNANKVDFKGGDGIEVTGKTTADGTREITIGLKKGEVISTNDASKTGTTTDDDGKTVNVVKASDGNWYPADQVTTTTDANGNAVVTPNEGATAVTTEVTTNTDGSGFVTGNQVADAIEASGWNVGKATADTMKNATGTALTGDTVEKVNPNDNVRYVDGTNITQTLKTATETNADGTTHTTTYIQADLNPNVTLGGNDAGKNGSLTINNTGDKPAAEVKTDTAGNGVVNVNDKDGNTGVAITANNGAGTVTINGSDGSQAAIGVVKAPTNLADMPAGAVNVDGKWYNPSDVTTTTDAAGNVTTTVNAGATPISNTMDRIQYTDANGTPHQVATMEDGLKFRGDDGQSISKPLNSTVELTGGNRTTTNADGSTTSAPVAKAATTTGNIGVFNDNGKMSVQLAKDLQGMNSATFGGDNNSAQTVINGNGVTVNPAGNTDPANAVSVTTNGVNAGNQRVTNVAPGRIAADSKDAVNGSQLYGITQNVNNLGNKVDRMDKDLRAGVAGANAAAGLPQVYLPGKSMVAASAGTFKGQNAVAIGYSRASDNGKVIFKLQGNANSQGDVGGSVGVGYQW